MNLCDRSGCTSQADGVLGVAVFPTKALMDFYRTDKALTRFITGLKLCKAHLADVDVGEMFPGPMMDNLIRVCELSSGVKVDRKALKAVMVAFDDPDFLVLQKQAKKP